MTGSELIQRLASKYTDLSHRDIDAIVSTILQSIVDYLAKDGREDIPGVGSFQNRVTPPKTGRNFKTGEKDFPVEYDYCI